MIHDLLLALVSALGAGAIVAAITLLVLYRRTSPEYPPPVPVQRDP